MICNCTDGIFVFYFVFVIQSSNHGRVRVEGISAQHFADDRLRGAAVGRGQAHPERLRQQVRRTRAPVHVKFHTIGRILDLVRFCCIFFISRFACMPTTLTSRLRGDGAAYCMFSGNVSIDAGSNRLQSVCTHAPVGLGRIVFLLWSSLFPCWPVGTLVPTKSVRFSHSLVILVGLRHSLWLNSFLGEPFTFSAFSLRYTHEIRWWPRLVAALLFVLCVA